VHALGIEPSETGVWDRRRLQLARRAFASFESCGAGSRTLRSRLMRPGGAPAPLRS